MPQYRVRCRVSNETLVDIVADNPTAAMVAAVEAFGGMDHQEVVALSAEVIAGQSAEPDVVETQSKYAAVLQGDEG